MNYYNDNDPYVCEWLRNLIRAGAIGDGLVDERPIQEIEPSDLNGFRQHMDGLGPISRVGTLRGSGNAIVPSVAATFIRAFLDTINHNQQ